MDEADGGRLLIRIERRGVRRYTCSGCGRRTGRVRSRRDRQWDDVPWAAHHVTLVYPQRRLICRHCGIRTERIEFADAKARVTSRCCKLVSDYLSILLEQRQTTPQPLRNSVSRA